MQPTQQVHKTNVIALVVLTIITLGIVGFYLNTDTSSSYEIAASTTRSQNITSNRDIQSTSTADIDNIDSEIDAALSIDNAGDLETIDSQF